MAFIKFLIPIVVVAVAVFFGYNNLKDLTFYEKNLQSEQNEIIVKENNNPVLSPTGKLNYIGWSRNPSPFYMNPESIRASSSITKYVDQLRYKKWEFYLFTSKDFMFGFAVFDMSVVKGHFIHYADLQDKESKLKKIEHISPFGNAVIPDNCKKNCKSANYTTEVDGIKLAEISKTSPNSHKMKLKASNADFNLDIDVTLDTPTPDSDSYVGFVPINEDSSLFFHTTKTNLLLPKGKIQINNKEYNTADFMACYDSGRGVWPIRSGWVWASGNGKAKDGSLLGLNFGHGFSHPKSTRSTEDIFYINGKGFKLGSSKTEIGPKLFEEFSDNEEINVRFDNEVKPNENHCQVNFKISKRLFYEGKILYLFQMKFIISYGVFSGRCTTADGTVYNFDDVYGILEYQNAIW